MPNLLKIAVLITVVTLTAIIIFSPLVYSADTAQKTVGELLNHDFTKGDLELYNTRGLQVYREGATQEEDAAQKTVGELLNHDFTKGAFELYNTRGLMVYREETDRSWFRVDYDSAGNNTFVKMSNGYWMEMRHDSKGVVVYREDSDSIILDNR